jgi:hypothetical protein
MKGTVAHDAVTQSAEFTTATPFTFSHTPVGIPKGILVAITRTGAATDYVSAVTYGGLAMTRTQFASDAAGEPGSAYLYFLGSGIPTGTQTVSISTDGNAGAKRATCVSVTAWHDTRVVASGLLGGDQADPQIALDGGIDAVLRYAFIFSGQNLSSALTEVNGTRIHDQSFAGGTKVSVGLVGTSATGSVTVGWTSTIEDVAMVAAAIDDPVDQTATYQAIINAAPNGTAGSPTVIDLPSGTYRIDGGLLMDNRQHLRLTCSTGVFTAWTSWSSADLGLGSRIHFEIIRCTDVVGLFMRIEGPNTGRDPDNPLYALYAGSLETDHAFALRSGSVDSGWEDCSFREVWGDGCYVGFQNDGIANEDVWVKRLDGLYPGRQCLALTHVVGFLGEDITIDFGARSGLDIEPNHANDKVWNVQLTRLSIGSQFNPYAITGSSNGALPQRQDITLTDCSTIRCASNHPAVLASRDPSTNLVIEGLVDTRQPSIYGLNISGAWENVTIRNCEVTTSNNTPATYAVNSNVTGSLVVQDNVFNGKPGTEGFDNLANFLQTPASYVHCGNVWAMGTQFDVPCNAGSPVPRPGAGLVMSEGRAVILKKG